MNSERQRIIDQLSGVTALDPDTIEEALHEVAEQEGVDAVREGLESLSERLIPTGEGLTRKEARKLLVREMDALTVAVNQSRLRNYKKAVDAWWKYQLAKREARINGVPYRGKKLAEPREPVFVPGFTMKRLNLAVAKARQDGRYEQLLAAAGF